MLRAFDPYVALIKTAFTVAAFAGTAWYFHGIGADGVQSKWDKERADAIETRATLNDAIRAGVDAITVAASEERKAANVQNNALRNDIRTGTLRLYAPVVVRSSNGTGIKYSETRAELVPAVAGRIIDVGIDGDDAVRDLNECVDKYNALAAKINQ